RRPWLCGMMLQFQFNDRVALSSCNRPGIIHLISTTKALKELNKEKSNQLEPRKRIQTLSGLLIMISTGLFGLYLIGNSDISPGAKLSSSTTGLILLSSCIIALLISFEKISKELSGARTKHH
ncbi:hypothetical protein, partial [Pseudomonas aeruginosa]|uniref:hypothetical protein n=1 Tax=Pseudomonas aeruginosa TaxID=287 RepID=UPI001C1326D7